LEIETVQAATGIRKARKQLLGRSQGYSENSEASSKLVSRSEFSFLILHFPMLLPFLLERYAVSYQNSRPC
jgi:hypothetical protein